MRFTTDGRMTYQPRLGMTFSSEVWSFGPSRPFPAAVAFAEMASADREHDA